VVQLVRIALNGRLRNTGRVQLDIQHPTLPFHAHPDGRIIGEDGDGILEAKTAGSATFKRFQSEGLPAQYVAQVQAQMGLSDLDWALVVLVSRENLAEMAFFKVAFDPEHYALLERRATIAAHALGDTEFLQQLAGEPDCGYCHTCPYSSECGAFQSRREAGKAGEIPEVIRLQLECQMDELNTLERQLEPIQERSGELREQIKATLSDYQITKVILEGGVLQMVTSTRTSFDSKAVLRDAPDLYNRYLKTSTFTNLRVTASKGAPCQSMAS